jgi:pimeloyl-ACP methyl ester carboxylesterase
MPEFTVAGTRYAYLDEGSGPLVLFGHGLFAGKEMFAAQIDALRDRWRCVALDWPGHGASGAPEAWTFDDMADVAVALLDELGEERAVLAGLSQGAMVFMRLAIRHPERVAALILMSTSARAPAPEDKDAILGLVEALRVGSDAERRALARDVLGKLLLGRSWPAAQPEAAAEALEIALAQDPDRMVGAARAIAAREDVLDALGAVRAPTLVLVGEEDVPTPVPEAEAIAAAVPGAELVRIPRAGHHAPVENPEDTTAAIEAFLTRVAAGSAA